jgi:hypothetical protein
MTVPLPEAPSKAWQALLAAEQREVALSVAQDVAARLCWSDKVDAAVAAARQQTTLPNSLHWPPHSVSQGYAGLALMCGHLDACFPGEHWDVVGHQYLDLAVRDLNDSPYFPLGVHAGLSGLALTTWFLSRRGRRYRTLQTTLDAMLAKRIPPFASSLAGQHGVSEPQFDLISGAAGIGAYLLCRPDHPDLALALTEVLRALIALTREEAGLPHWHTPAHLLMDPKMRPLFPNGNFNCGLAHGIPGPLATLALALSEGVEVEGLATAVDTLARWLVTHRADDQWGINWPSVLAVPGPGTDTDDPDHGAPRLEGPCRAAWCYGAPGLARALWLAGCALRSSEYCDLAIAAMEAIYRRPISARMIDSPLFCHGVAGLLHVTLRFAHDTGLPLFTGAARTLAAQLLELYEPESLTGYRRIEPSGVHVDNPGLLDGAAGVVVTLLAAATPIKPAYDRLFLLA